MEVALAEVVLARVAWARVPWTEAALAEVVLAEVSWMEVALAVRAEVAWKYCLGQKWHCSIAWRSSGTVVMLVCSELEDF